MEKTYNHQVVERELQEWWQHKNMYATDRQKGEPFAIDTPPPTVSGSLHIGHIFSYTQTDISARFKRMSGYAVFYPFGFDDNGLATERFVEKKCGVVAHRMKRSDFIALCLKETQEIEGHFQQLWQRMGLSVDWQYCYSTISNDTRHIAQQSFIDLYKKGFVYRKNEPALFCTTCRTSVAQAELDDQEKPSAFHDIAFKAHNGSDLVISTTRPELLYSCVALFYHPNDARYQHLKNSTARVPLYGHAVPILPDEQVIPEKGTGLVMCCTFGDKTDIAWFKKHGFVYRQAIGIDGRITADVAYLGGLKVAEARVKIVELLSAAGDLKSSRAITHAVNIHERCKQDIEYLMLPQWFLSLLPYKKTFIELADQISWYPDYMKSRYQNWVEHISWDWCLSRQRFFGIPFPAWHCVSCAKVVLASVENLPVDPQEQKAQTACVCGGELVPDTDVMDTWNTSSLTPYICKALYRGDTAKVFDFSADESARFIPMAMRPQAHDIIRTWAFYTIVKSWMHEGKIPWESIVISGHVLTGSKEKISKSQSNSPLVPENLLAQYPADAVRYWTASASLGTDVSFSDNQLKIGQRLIVKLWNAFRFIEEHLGNEVPVQPQNLDALNAWLLDRIRKAYVSYSRYGEKQEFSLALDAVEQCFWHDFCDNYIELIKDQLFNPHLYSPTDVAATRWTLYQAGLSLLQMYAPFVPYVTEAIYRARYATHMMSESLHTTHFNNVQHAYENPQAVATIHQVTAVVAQVRKLKSDNKLSLKTPLATLAIVAPARVQMMLSSQHALLKGATKATTLVMQAGDGVADLTQSDALWHATVVLACDSE